MESYDKERKVLFSPFQKELNVRGNVREEKLKTHGGGLRQKDLKKLGDSYLDNFQPGEFKFIRKKGDFNRKEGTREVQECSVMTRRELNVRGIVRGEKLKPMEEECDKGSKQIRTEEKVADRSPLSLALIEGQGKYR